MHVLSIESCEPVGGGAVPWSRTPRALVLEIAQPICPAPTPIPSF